MIFDENENVHCIIEFMLISQCKSNVMFQYQPYDMRTLCLRLCEFPLLITHGICCS